MLDPSDTYDAEIDLTPGTAKSDIIAVLYGNPDTRFSTNDIQERLDIPHETVSTTLTRLNNDGLIGQTEENSYHALDYREDLRRYVGSLNQLERMFDDKSYDEHTDIAGSQLEDIDEDELESEIVELEADLYEE